MQGFNMGRYVPPDLEGVQSANQVSGKHALGARANKIKQGILTVRFEMPFPIWCTTCPKPSIIGQGVRFNAEKKKVGNYYSTPIYSFRMKHVACGGSIEIRTDPQNTAYVVTEGAKKRDLGEDRLQEGEVRIGASEEDRKRLEEDAFAALEAKKDDARQAAGDKSRIEALYRANDRSWDDPGEANRRIRRGFRAERKVRQQEEGATEALKDRMSLAMDLLEETEDDRRRAGFVEFGEQGRDMSVAKVQSKPLFNSANAPSKPPSKKVKKSSKASEAKQRRANLQREIGQNTRMAIDPFLGNSRIVKATPKFARRKEAASSPRAESIQAQHIVADTTKAEQQDGTTGVPLVDYDSD